MIRGGLAGLGQGLFSGNVDAEADKLGAVMELFQSALLIHDDIMDRDLLRRGKPAMHVQFAGISGRKELWMRNGQGNPWASVSEISPFSWATRFFRPSGFLRKSLES